MARMVNARLIGGPLDGQTRQVSSTDEVLKISPKATFFTYTYAGKDGNTMLFAIRPKSRAVRRFVNATVQKHAVDPRVNLLMSRPKPYRKSA